MAVVVPAALDPPTVGSPRVVGKIPIGSFGRLTGLSAKAQRDYHDLGVLVPAHVDPDTAYRTYDVDQIDDAVRIAVLRQADMPLVRIGRVLESPDRADDVIAGYRAAESPASVSSAGVRATPERH